MRRDGLDGPGTIRRDRWPVKRLINHRPTAAMEAARMICAMGKKLMWRSESVEECSEPERPTVARVGQLESWGQWK